MACSMLENSYVAIWVQEWTQSPSVGGFWVRHFGLVPFVLTDYLLRFVIAIGYI